MPKDSDIPRRDRRGDPSSELIVSRGRPSVMTGLEYATMRKQLGLSQARFAQLCGIHEMTVSQRERGKKPINHEAFCAVRMLWLEANYSLPEMK